MRRSGIPPWGGSTIVQPYECRRTFSGTRGLGSVGFRPDRSLTLIKEAVVQPNKNADELANRARGLAGDPGHARAVSACFARAVGSKDGLSRASIVRLGAELRSVLGSGIEGISMRIHIPVSLRWGDLDAYNHVNNVEIFRLLEEARVRAFWAPLDPGEERPPTAIFEPEGGSLSLIAGHQIEYLRPIDYQRTPLDVQLWITRIGGASAGIGYEIHGTDGLGPFARASSTMVFVNGADYRPRRMTDQEKAAWTPYLGEAVAFSARG